MKSLSVENMEAVQGGYNVLATFGCGAGVAFMIFQPYSVFAIGEATALVCAAAIASL